MSSRLIVVPAGFRTSVKVTDVLVKIAESLVTLIAVPSVPVKIVESSVMLSLSPARIYSGVLQRVHTGFGRCAATGR